MAFPFMAMKKINTQRHNCNVKVNIDQCLLIVATILSCHGIFEVCSITQIYLDMWR